MYHCFVSIDNLSLGFKIDGANVGVWHDYCPEFYVCNHLPRAYRRSLVLFRCGVSPLKVETARYSSTPLNDRTCLYCKDGIEDECHVLMHCPLYRYIF